MNNRIRSMICAIIGGFIIMLCISSKFNDEAFYEDAKQTDAIIEKITQEEKKVYRKRGKYRREKTEIEYDAHISYQVDNNGEIISKTAVLSDVSSNLKVGDTITVFYKGSDVRMQSKAQSNIRNTVLGIFGVVMLLVGIIGNKLSKSNSEYDELSGEENIYNERHNY